MTKFIRNNIKLYMIVLAITIVVFLPFIILNKGVMIFPGDSYEQVFKMWLGGYNLIHGSGLSQFNWSLGFGGSLFSFAFYFLFDPFFYLCLAFSVELIPYFMLISTILQILIGFIISHLWLSSISKNKSSSIVGSFIIVFSGAVFFLLHYNQYMKIIVFYPLILYFTERYLCEKRSFALGLSIGLLGISNFYLLYQFIPFLFLYTLFRYLVINKGLKSIVIEGMKFIFITILGIGISAVVLLPCLSLVLQMPRFSNSNFNIFSIMTPTQLFDLFGSLFTPTISRLDASYFVNSSYVGALGWGGGMSMYSLAFTPFVLLGIFKLKDKWSRNLILIFYFILISFLCFRGFSYLFQMSMETRWLYMFVFLNAYSVTTVLESEIDKKYLIISCIITLLVQFLMLGMSLKFQLNNIYEIKVLCVVLLINSVISISFLLYLTKYKIDKVLLVILASNAVFSGFTFYYANRPIDYSKIITTPNFKQISHSIDDNSFYRVLYDLNIESDFETSHANEPFSLGFKGGSFYSSIYNTNQEEYLNRYKSTWNMPQMQGRNESYNLLSFKYWYTYQNNRDVPFGYKFYKSDGNMDIYINDNYVELGFLYDKTINKEAIQNLSYFEQDRVMNEYLITETSENSEYVLNDGVEYVDTLSSSNVRVYDFAEDVNNSIIYIENYGIPNVLVDLYYRDEIVDTYDFWQFNYVDFYVDQPIDKIVITGEDIYGSGTEINLYIRENMDSYTKQFEKLTENKLENVVVQGDNVYAVINSDEEGYLFTSIPFDLGWTVYVDGRKIDYEKVNLGFIGFNLDKGYHEIEFKYSIPYLKEGIIISTISIVIVFIIDIRRRRKRNEVVK
ncbi:MAG: YfhO family protein [Anaerorhabdus sp.]|uniref:YfhO family protein n=1 Tax=Anaerorhabdus sp. TaxID=1872524 RepID=UPI002FC74310